MIRYTKKGLRRIMPRLATGLTALLLLAAGLWAVPALAIESGEVECHSSPGYLVVQRGQKDSSSEYLVKKAQPSEKIPCRFVSGPGDIPIGKGRRYVFVALKGDLLLMRDSKGKGKSYKESLSVFDLKEGAKETALGEVYMVGRVGEEEVELSIPSNLKPTRERCPRYASWFEPDPLGQSKKAVADEVKDLRVERKAVFSFASRKIVESSETQCVFLGE